MLLSLSHKCHKSSSNTSATGPLEASVVAFQTVEKSVKNPPLSFLIMNNNLQITKKRTYGEGWSLATWRKKALKNLLNIATSVGHPVRIGFLRGLLLLLALFCRTNECVYYFRSKGKIMFRPIWNERKKERTILRMPKMKTKTISSSEFEYNF